MVSVVDVGDVHMQRPSSLQVPLGSGHSGRDRVHMVIVSIPQALSDVY